MDTETLLSTSSDIAIIGMSCRVPGANNTEQFWTNLKQGIESVDARAQPEGLDLFDAQFFKFTPRQAQITDPQVRLFLEAAWDVFEHAGYEPTSSVRPIGVYAGMGSNAYLSKVLSNSTLVKTVGRVGINLANERSSLSCTTSYKLNLRGPSLTVQTACSTSLVATHLACQALLEGECDLALAGAVSLSIPDGAEYAYEEGGILSPDGHCRAFDVKANGTVGGSGVCVVLLKRLQDAVADRDHIRAVIKGSAVNNDGVLKAGYTAPSSQGQAIVIRAAQIVGQINAESISYVEAHGTGTPLGDPIEVAALTEAFRSSTDKKHFCGGWSCRFNQSNIGTGK
jgi:acyl transferase domain-containing protein